MKPFSSRLTAISVAVMSVYSVAAYADTVELDAVNVTARGYQTQNLETAGSMVTLGRNELDRRQAHSVGEALRGEVGIAIANDGTQGQNPLIRGLGKDSTVLLVDGMRVNSAQPVGAISSFISLGLAERLEVVKGGASVLYGTGAMGGALNVLMPQARFIEGAKLRAAAGYDSVNDAWRGSGVLNVSRGDHAFMLGVSGSDLRDYETPKGHVEHSGYHSQAVIGQYRWRLTPQHELRASAQWHRDTDVWYPGSTRQINPKNPQVGLSTIHSPENERRLYEVGYTYQSGGALPLNLDVRAYRQEMERSIYSWAQRFKRDMVTNHVTFRTDGVDARADWAVHDAHILSFGVNAWKMTASPNRHIGPPPMFKAAVNNPFRDGEIEALGIYLQNDMRFGRLNVLAGVRWDKVRGSAAVMNPDAPNPKMRRTAGLAHEDSAVSGNLSAIYEVAPLFRPYAAYARAFRAPDLRERFESGLRGDGYYYTGSPEVKAETADQFEIGVKGGDDTLTYHVAAFHYKISDYLTGKNVPTQSTPACAGQAFCKKTVNLGSVTLHGVEAQASWRVTPSQRLNLSYSRVRGQNKDLNEPLFKMPADEWTLGWIGRVAPAVQADVNLRMVHSQKRVATQFSRGTENKTAGFVTADLGLTWQAHKNHQLRVAVKNVTNKAYHEHLTEGASGREILSPARNVQLLWRGEF